MNKKEITSYRIELLTIAFHNLAKLLISKGLITEIEWKALLKRAEEELEEE